MEFFLCNKRKIVLKPTIHQNSLHPQKHYWKNVKITDHKSSIFNSENYWIPCRHRLLGKATKQPLSNFESQKHK